mmetsp:Transcript_32489/g.69184  ORF Transcript_32489/g.69184 Transcript_32489/m.69184 type:complete len:305 (-) Transcript_32489:823-1737(-)
MHEDVVDVLAERVGLVLLRRHLHEVIVVPVGSVLCRTCCRQRSWLSGTMLLVQAVVANDDGQRELGPFLDVRLQLNHAIPLALSEHDNRLQRVHNPHANRRIEAQLYVVAGHAGDLRDAERLLPCANEATRHVRGRLEAMPARREELDDPILVANAILAIPHCHNIERPMRDHLLRDVHATGVLKKRRILQVHLPRIQKHRLSTFDAKAHFPPGHEDAMPSAGRDVLVGEALDAQKGEATLAHEVAPLEQEVPLAIHQTSSDLALCDDDDLCLPYLDHSIVDTAEPIFRHNEASLIDEVYAVLK